MLKFTKSTLSKLEDLISEGGYSIRYEKGSFKPGYCILENKKVVVLNKYHELETKINNLVEMMPLLDLNQENFSETSKKLLDTLNQTELQL